MRKNICLGALALSLMVSLATLPAAAKSVDNMRAQVPFDFHVGESLVPAGAYTIKSMTADEQMLRISGDKSSAATTTNSGKERGNGEGRARLVFHKYGDQYFLSAVWGSDSTGRTLTESKRERNLRKELRAARAAAEVEIVTIDVR
ncbi:MAG: hypothetical protein ACJ74T_16615 [Pyrinomonadaceae bacterium]